MTGPRLRLRTDDDLDDCVRMLGEVHERYGYPVNWPDDPRAWLRAGLGDAWVGTIAGSCAGHIGLRVEGRCAFVERFFVDPGHGGRGLGRALLRLALAEGRARVGEVCLDVVAADDAANRLYRREGWSEISRTPIAWGPTQESTLIRFQSP